MDPEKNKHIPSETIIADIKDTQQEINEKKTLLVLLEKNPVENRLRIYMEKGKISSREEFITSLKCLLTYRNIAI